jgi:drug/metabolite transporter (DMT)-like permease
MGWLFFAETIRPSQCLACALIVGAIVMSPSRALRGLATNIARR